MRYRRDTSGEIVAEEKDEVPGSKEDGIQRWRKEMEMRFLRGDDEDFDYTNVDESEEYDNRSVEEREEEEQWFEDEEPAWTMADESNEAADAKTLIGQTGVQDY